MLRPTIRNITKLVCKEFNVTEKELMDRRGTWGVCGARVAVYWLLRRLTMISYTNIGLHFQRDHTTIIAGYDHCRELRAHYFKYKLKTDILFEQFEDTMWRDAA